MITIEKVRKFSIEKRFTEAITAAAKRLVRDTEELMMEKGQLGGVKGGQSQEVQERVRVEEPVYGEIKGHTNKVDNGEGRAAQLHAMNDQCPPREAASGSGTDECSPEVESIWAAASKAKEKLKITIDGEKVKVPFDSPPCSEIGTWQNIRFINSAEDKLFTNAELAAAIDYAYGKANSELGSGSSLMKKHLENLLEIQRERAAAVETRGPSA